MNLKYKTFAAIYFGVILILSPFVALYVSTIIYFVSLVNFVKGAWISLYKEDEEEKEEKKEDKSKESSTSEQVVEDSTAIPEPLVISLDEALAAANQHLSYSGVIKLTFPEEPQGDLAISKSRTGFFARAGADQLKLNVQTLELKEKVLFAELPVRQQIGKSVKALHTGEIFGQFTKFLWAVACAIATSLPITGTMIWLNKRKKKRGTKGVQEAKNSLI